MGIDPRNQVVVATVNAYSESPFAQSGTLQLAQGLAGVDVSIDIVEVPAVVPLNALGGAELWKDFQTFLCTTGFTVTSGSNTGIATAGHCGHPSGMFYWDPFANVDHAVTYQGGFVGNWGDFEWFTSTGSEVDDFYHSSAGAARDVTGVKNAFSVGDPLNWYGRKSNTEYSGTVRYTNIWAGSTGNLVCMNQGSGAPGDSGGPVYTGGTAAGYVTALVWIDNAYRLCFSQTRYIDDAIGVSIKTS